MKFRPLNDRLLVQRVEHEEKSAGGLFLPESAKEKPLEGIVMAVGKGRRGDDGSFRPMDVKEGDRVMFAKYTGDEVKISGEEFMVLREDDIVAIVE